MSAHGAGVAGLKRPIDDGTKRIPSWNMSVTKVPLNQGVQFQQEIINKQLRSETEIAAYLKSRAAKPS